MAAYALEAEGLEVEAGGQTLLADLSFGVAPGRRLGVTGPSGCGKSTLLRAVARLIEPAAGVVRLEGRTAEEHGWRRYRRRVTLVNQTPALLDADTATNLARPFNYHSAAGGFPEARAREWLERLRLNAGSWDKNARELSVGQQQRVCVVRALLLEPAAVLLDEPTSALDEEAMGRVEELIAAEAGRTGLAAVIVTHDASQAERWCDERLELTPYVRGGAIHG